MTRFLKTTGCLLVFGSMIAFSSCKNEEEQREEANASVVNIEKGVADPVWTSDSENAPKSKKEVQKAETPAPQVEEPQPQEMMQQMVEESAEGAPKAEQPAPAPKQEVKPEPKPESNPEVKPEVKKEKKPAPKVETSTPKPSPQESESD